MTFGTHIKVGLLSLLVVPVLSFTANSQDTNPEEKTEPAFSAEEEAQICLETDDVKSYKVESDQIIRFIMDNDIEYIMKVKRLCPQLYFHKYISYTPVNGRLCAGVDEIKTRSGLPCRIESLEKIVKTPPANYRH